MRSLILLLLCLFLVFVPTIFADDLPTDLSAVNEGIMATKSFNAFEKGDGILSLSLGAMFPLGYYHFDSTGFLAANSYPGFAFSLSYTGFFLPDWAIEGEFAGGFIGTQNKDSLFIAPISVRIARYFPLGAFAIAPSAGPGINISAISGYKHIDPLLKIGSSFLWKASPDMSYSLKVYGDFIPQFFKDSDKSMFGFFLETTLSIAYHM